MADLIIRPFKKVRLSFNFLSIKYHENGITKSKPSKLEYSNLDLIINTWFWSFFLKIRKTLLLKLLIQYIRYGRGEEQGKVKFLPYIRVYIVKKKRTKYLAFQDYFHNQTFINDNSLKYEVKEFRLYNIIVQN